MADRISSQPDIVAQNYVKQVVQRPILEVGLTLHCPCNLDMGVFSSLGLIARPLSSPGLLKLKPLEHLLGFNPS